MSVAPHVSDSMAPRMAPSNVTESQSGMRRMRQRRRDAMAGARTGAAGFGWASRRRGDGMLALPVVPALRINRTAGKTTPSSPPPRSGVVCGLDWKSMAITTDLRSSIQLIALASRSIAPQSHHPTRIYMKTKPPDCKEDDWQWLASLVAARFSSVPLPLHCGVVHGVPRAAITRGQEPAAAPAPAGDDTADPPHCW
jgi:hypothetical protein